MQMCMLQRTKCQSARFVGADLTYADMSHADVSDADFSRATLFRAVLHRVKDSGSQWTSRAAAYGDNEELAEAEDWQRNVLGDARGTLEQR